MKLMRLSPESQRLRRIARAYAAGESSLTDYRHLRRQILNGLQQAMGRQADDTHRRPGMGSWTRPFDAAETVTRAPIAAVAAVPASSAARSALPPRRGPRISSRWLIAGLGLVILSLWAALRA
ncbi:MAG: hypothetical protein H6993_18860 [Pseudomonadales bacterium]|nr:hypothetical protein [Pseudomonadales bacterium]MCP5186035.1 hypothetical protein [Pseudomonadales bacterium]